MKKLLLLLTLCAVSTTMQPAGNDKKKDKKSTKKSKIQKQSKKQKNKNEQSSLNDKHSLKQSALPSEKIKRQIGAPKHRQLLELPDIFHENSVDNSQKINNTPLVTETQTPQPPTQREHRYHSYIPYVGGAVTATVLIGYTLYYFNKPIIKRLADCKKYIITRLCGNL